MLNVKMGKQKRKSANKGQIGTVYFWIYALVGVITVITVYIVFDNVLWADSSSLKSALVPMGLNMSSSTMVTLQGSWNMWPIAFIFAWALALIIVSITREPDVGVR